MSTRTPENALWSTTSSTGTLRAKEWTWVTNYPDAIKVLQTGRFREVSLDGSLDESSA